MSASLVGSEMCIRDSTHTPIDDKASHVKRHSAASRPSSRALEFGKPGPVSYTHLTLPTICSV
eukprot:13375476-Alexandrium_andersonii.AAC.1